MPRRHQVHPSIEEDIPFAYAEVRVTPFHVLLTLDLPTLASEAPTIQVEADSLRIGDPKDPATVFLVPLPEPVQVAGWCHRRRQRILEFSLKRRDPGPVSGTTESGL